MRKWIVTAAVSFSALSLFALTKEASAFCGFYVSGADAKLFNNATQVVIMREGQRTVLSMQNGYEGPPENFAMVVPVPVVLQKENVKTLPQALFDKIDQLTSPRLVEYWERDPCDPNSEFKHKEMVVMGRSAAAKPEAAGDKDYGVKIEAQFTVGEYEVVVLSANDSSGLDRWLRDNKYKIPEGAEPYLKPYVQSGSKFFVAKVDTTKVKFVAGKAVLSPLRFHYDADTFTLPIRLGLINSQGTQDLIVNVLARGQRYEVANYANVTIPTNLDVAEEAKGKFGSFYAALFDKTLEKNARAVVTEYAWDAGTCDPCPGPALNASELATLGADALVSATPPPPNQSMPSGPPGARPMPPAFRGRVGWGGNGFVITRLHARYTKDNLGEDLIFRAAPPITGGREVRMGSQEAPLEKGARAGGINNFQGRYAVRHPWKGALACANPVRGRWGGPPASEGIAQPGTTPATKIQDAPRGGVALASLVSEDVPELDLKSLAPSQPLTTPKPAAAPPTNQPETKNATDTTDSKSSSSGSKSSGGCGSCRMGAGAPSSETRAEWSIAALLGLAMTRLRRRP